jgi:two-component system, cell cycle response regulator DivK
MAKILVVEDNPQNLKLATVILRSQGHEVVQAVNALEAEAAVAHDVPDLIVMDVALPGKDGYAITSDFRRRPETSRVPILAVSAFAMAGDAEKALSAGCNDYLTKPVRRAELLERVARLLQLSGIPVPAPRRPTASTSRARSTAAGGGRPLRRRRAAAPGDPKRNGPASLPAEVGPAEPATAAEPNGAPPAEDPDRKEASR